MTHRLNILYKRMIFHQNIFKELSGYGLDNFLWQTDTDEQTGAKEICLPTLKREA